MKTIHLIPLALSLLVAASCSSKPHTWQVTLNYHGSTKLVLDIPAEHRHELREALEKACAPTIINGRPANVRYANENNLNGYSITLETDDSQLFTGLLYNNAPFGIGRGGSGTYNFEHVLTEQDADAIRIYIPAWKK